MSDKQPVVVYTTETPYKVIANDFFEKFNNTPGVTIGELISLERKWRSLTKLALNGKLTGKKYV